MTATLAGPMRLSIDALDPAYGASGEADTEPDGAATPIHLDVETPERHWRPIDPDPGIQRPEAVLFVDGVRRIDARAWVDTQPAAGGPARTAVQGLCASYAAGVICCRTEHAHLLTTDVRRGLFTTTTHATDLHTHAGTYRLNITPPRSGIPHVQALSLALQRSLADVEIDVAATARATLPDHRRRPTRGGRLTTPRPPTPPPSHRTGQNTRPHLPTRTPHPPHQHPHRRPTHPRL